MGELTTMPKYEAYKDSGVEWLGIVPEHWDLTRIATRFEERRTKVSDKDFPPLSVTKNGIVPQLANAAKSNDGDNRKLVKNGDFVINSRSDRKGSSGVADRDGSVSLINIVMEPKNIIPKYCEYLLKSYNFIEEFYRMGHGIVADLWTTRYDEMKAVTVSIPPTVEQTAIANFLDKKTTQIDEAIAIKEKQIELLKERKQIIIQQAVTQGISYEGKPNAPMKDSGVDWIGEIPEDWEVVKFKYLADVRYGLGQPPKEHPNGLKIIRATNVERGKIVEKGMLFVDPDDIPWDRNPTLQKGEIIVVRSGAYTGDTAIVTTEYSGSIAGYDMVATPTKAHPEFLSKVLLSHYVLYEQIYLLRARSAQPHLNAEELKELLIVAPPIAEQKVISDYISTIENGIDVAVGVQQQQIEKLKEYKTTLINSAVTGKIKVPEVDSVIN